ncbi:MAG: hypothetical protein Q9160_005924 [Pyrenula sp. 1 TL-2023]
MGVFATIPVEIRDQIWFKTPFLTKASIVQTCKQLNIDYRDWLYNEIELVFNLDPRQRTEKPSPSIIQVINQEGDLVCNLPLGSLQNGKKLPFCSFPFDKVQSFTFLLHAPQGDCGSGELIRLWKMITYLLPALHKNVSSWPQVIVVDVQETTSRSWRTFSTPTESAYDLLAGQTHASHYSDIEIALLPFSILRPPHAPPQFVVPECIRSRRIDEWIISSVEKYSPDSKTTPSETTPETTTRQGDPPLYNLYHPMIAVWNLWLEEELDMIQDDSATSLRLERCANWSKASEKEYACWLWGRLPRRAATHFRDPSNPHDAHCAIELLRGIDSDERLL